MYSFIIKVYVLNSVDYRYNFTDLLDGNEEGAVYMRSFCIMDGTCCGWEECSKSYCQEHNVMTLNTLFNKYGSFYHQVGFKGRYLHQGRGNFHISGVIPLPLSTFLSSQHHYRMLLILLADTIRIGPWSNSESNLLSRHIVIPF